MRASNLLLGLALLIEASACQPKETLFEALPASHTGIHFANQVEENDKYNVLSYMNIYTGAGVAAGDINNDGLTDLFFSGNHTSGRLYLNKGNLQFDDISETAGVISNRWQTGVSMVDINQDGRLDIYVNVSGNSSYGNMANLLYVNQGNGPDGRPTFREQAKAYGLAETRQTMNASFFDYDRDGDLDVFLITNPADDMMSGVNSVQTRQVQGESEGTDILYRNNGIDRTVGHPTFTDVSHEAGILNEGYSLGAAISDVNGDGWPDIYVSNDFLTNDILYINNGNGTFTDRLSECVKHTSFASMGNDVADINNDGLPDIFVLDMLPEDNYRRKMLIPAASYEKFELSVERGYEPQYTRNTLQLNNGNSQSGLPSFSDISFLSGVSSTDWSWSALWGDYDNDGDKDLMVTNGFYRDLGNLDYINYQSSIQSPMGQADTKRAEKLKAIHSLNTVPLQNYLFENNQYQDGQPEGQNRLTFTKRSDEWGFTDKGFSNGACYADLDNDGDLELVINRFNSEAQIYKNWSNERLHHTYLSIKLEGSPANRQGIGAKVWLYDGGHKQLQEQSPYRGYESSVDPILHFGLGSQKQIDSLVVEWPDGKRQLMLTPAINQLVTIAYANKSPSLRKPADGLSILFKPITGTQGLTYQHKENVYVDFAEQPLLPHLHSRNGPGIAVGDVNGDGWEDFYIGGSAGTGGRLYIQDGIGAFHERPFAKPSLVDEMGVLLFDADGDHDLDLFIVGGGTEQPEDSDLYQSRYYQNDGTGNFQFQPGALPRMNKSGSCVIAGDYDADGDLDLFVGGRVTPGHYPLPTRSYLLRNEGRLSTSGTVHFTDVTAQICPDLVQPGMVTAALWTDMDNDNRLDLLVTGEFMPILVFKNNGKKLLNKTAQAGTATCTGWWNSLIGQDFDGDGDIDYVAGNLGLNSRYQAHPAQPLCIYGSDFDKNGRFDPVLCYYVQGKEYISHARSDLIKQINPMRARFKTFDEYARASVNESFREDELTSATMVKSECFESSYFENKGGGHFERKALPIEAQIGPVYGMLAGDYNGDSYPDLLITGNSYATEASTGRYDALTGLLLTGDGNGHFAVQKSVQTGFQADKDSKGLVELAQASAGVAVLVGVNNGPLEAYVLTKKPTQLIPIQASDQYAIVQTKSGKSYKQEFYYGQGYLSQPGRYIRMEPSTASIVIVDQQNNRRNLAGR